MKLIDLIENSGDSLLKNAKYSNQKLFVHMGFDELDNEILFDISTNIVELEISENESPELRTCHIEILNLNEELDVKNGIYVASKDFGQFMKQKRRALNLAYGLSNKKYKYMFALVGASRMLSCVITDVDSIDFQMIEYGSPEISFSRC